MTLKLSADQSIDLLQWLAGTWVGELGEQQVEETWTAPRHGCIENKVRLSSAEDIVLIELMTVREKTTAGERTLVLQLRQFNADLDLLTAQSMELSELTSSRVAFTTDEATRIRGLAYGLEADGRMA
ncbi:MAG: DUF6265 family protein, partial [Pseudomonadota bacterium]